jgi:hypothetical protein
MGWRRQWDSNFPPSFRFCKLQIPRSQGRRRCQRCRGALHPIARWLCRIGPFRHRRIRYAHLLLTSQLDKKYRRFGS